jgi:hypothetical protein
VATNKPLHTEPRAARFGEINVVGRGPVNGVVIHPIEDALWSNSHAILETILNSFDAYRRASCVGYFMVVFASYSGGRLCRVQSPRFIDNAL